MKYNKEPETQRAKQVWNFITNKMGKQPDSLECEYPNKYNGSNWWVAQFGKRFIPIAP